VKVLSPKTSQVQSLTPRESKVNHVRVTLATQFGYVGEPLVLKTSEVRSPEGDVVKGVPEEYELDVMGPHPVDAQVSNINDATGAFDLSFTPGAPGASTYELFSCDSILSQFLL